MILDHFLEFTETRVGDPLGTLTHGSNIIDLGLGRQDGPPVTPPFSGNPLGVAIPPPERGGGARDMGIGDDPALKILAQTVGNVVGGTSIQLSIEGAPDAAYGTPLGTALAVPGVWRMFAQGPVITTAQLNTRTAPGGGARLFDVDMPRVPWVGPLPRYLRIAFNKVGTFTGGRLRTYLVLDRYDQIISTQGFESGYLPGVTVPN